MKKHLILNVIFAILCFSCKKSTVYNPVNYNENDFMQYSKEQGKKLQQDEEKKIEIWIKNNQPNQFTKTNSGFWMEITKNNNNPTAKELQIVNYQTEILDLNGNTIYSFEENGIKKMVLGKTHEIRSIEKAIRLMAEKEEATIITPSFLAYGLYGDENKIGKFQSLLIKIKLLSVTDFKKEQTN